MKNKQLIGKIVADLQDFSKPLKPFIRKIDLKRIVDSLLLTIETGKNIKVVSEIEDDIEKLKVDQDYLKRLLT